MKEPCRKGSIAIIAEVLVKTTRVTEDTSVGYSGFLERSADIFIDPVKMLWFAESRLSHGLSLKYCITQRLGVADRRTVYSRYR